MNRLIRTELLKQRTVLTFRAGIAAAPLVAGLVTVAVFDTAGTQGNEPLSDTSLVLAIGAPLSVVTVIALFLGILGMAGEYRHQTITTTFLSTPRRRDVVVAKLAAHALTGALIGVLSVLTSLAIAVPWLLSSDVAARLDSDALRVAAGLVGSSALYGALGVSIGALVRNQTAACAGALVWLLAIEGFIGNAFRGSDLLRWLPAAAGRAIVQFGPSSDGPPEFVAAAVFGAYVVAFAVAAMHFTVRRDVT